VDWHRLAELRPRAGMLEDGTVLAPSVLLTALCDAEVLPMVFTGPARPLRLGRTRRLFTGGQHAVLAARDGGCSFPGCTRPPVRARPTTAGTGPRADAPTSTTAVSSVSSTMPWCTA
jgi:hypothetical protein